MVFFFRIASRAIAVAENLLHRNIRVNRYCSRCFSELETSDHIFFTCTHRQQYGEQHDSHVHFSTVWQYL